MGYNLSRTSFNRNKPQLDQLVEEQRTIRFPSTRPAKLARKIREAVASCEIFEDLKEKYYDYIKRHYIFKTVKGAVIAYHDENPLGTPIGEDASGDDFESMGEMEGEVKKKEELKKREVREVINLIELLVSMSEEKEAEEMYFPNAVLDDKSKNRLFNWTQKEENSHWSFVDHLEKGITLTQKEVPEELLWSKEEKNAPPN